MKLAKVFNTLVFLVSNRTESRRIRFQKEVIGQDLDMLAFNQWKYLQLFSLERMAVSFDTFQVPVYV